VKKRNEVEVLIASFVLANEFTLTGSIKVLQVAAAVVVANRCMGIPSK